VITVGIVLLNTILKNGCIFIIGKIGLPYNSDEISRIVVAVFIAQYFNIGLVLLIANASFYNTPFAFLHVSNLFSDYTAEWYS